MPPPLVLWVVPVSEPGGVARHVLDVARAGIPGFRVAVLCPPGPLAAELRAVGAAVLTGPFGPRAHPPGRGPRLDDVAPHPGEGSHGTGGAPYPGAPRPAAAASAAVGAARAAAASSATLRHAVRALRPVVVHSHLAYADLICVAVLRGLPVPGVPRRDPDPARPVLVSTEHGIAGDAALYHADPVRARTVAALHTRRLRVTDGRIAVSHATARAMQRRWRARDVVVVPNGVDRGDLPKPVVPGADRGPRVLSLSRLSREKNLDAVLRSMVHVRRRFPAAHLTLAGEGPEREPLRARIMDLGLQGHVSMPGHLPAGPAMAAHDVVLQLSRWENCSYTLLDAAAAGLGVVATDVGGNREILPARCLAPPADADLPVAVAHLVARQTEPGERPGLPSSWPTVQDMTRAVAAVYTALLDRTEVPG